MHIFKYALSALMALSCHQSAGQFLIQALNSTDGCFPGSTTLEVVAPQTGYSYSWFIGGYDCPGQGSPALYATGTQIQAFITGEFYCIGTPTGGLPEISNPINIRLLPGMPGSMLMPAPALYGGNTQCVTSTSLCIPAIYYAIWPGTLIKWYKGNVQIPGAVIGSYAATASGYYKYTITSGCMTAWSDSSLVTILPDASITAAATSFCAKDSVLLNAGTDAGYTYQWIRNGVTLAGAATQAYYATATGYYSVIVTNSCGTDTSALLYIKSNALPSAKITAGGPTTFCKGDSVTLLAPDKANRAYQWRRNGVDIPGANSVSYLVTASGRYKVRVTNTNSGCSKTTGTATQVKAYSKPAATITPLGSTTFCLGDSVVLQANTGTGFSYKWKKDGIYISGATSTTYTAIAAGTYKVNVTKNNGCSKTSHGVVVTVPCRELQAAGSAATRYDDDVLITPNPNNGQFVVSYALPTENPGVFLLFDVHGLKVYEEPLPPGNTNHQILLPVGVGSGIYRYEVAVSAIRRTGLIIVVGN